MVFVTPGDVIEDGSDHSRVDSHFGCVFKVPTLVDVSASENRLSTTENQPKCLHCVGLATRGLTIGEYCSIVALQHICVMTVNQHSHYKTVRWSTHLQQQLWQLSHIRQTAEVRRIKHVLQKNIAEP